MIMMYTTKGLATKKFINLFSGIYLASHTNRKKNISLFAKASDVAFMAESAENPK